MLKVISERLFNFGIPVNLDGYQYLRWCINYCVKQKSLPASYIHLYMKCAKDFNTTSSRVEHAMRHAIEVGCDRGDVAQKFGCATSAFKAKPTVSEFIAKVADDIILEMQEAM